MESEPHLQGVRGEGDGDDDEGVYWDVGAGGTDVKQPHCLGRALLGRRRWLTNRGEVSQHRAETLLLRSGLLTLTFTCD